MIAIVGAGKEVAEAPMFALGRAESISQPYADYLDCLQQQAGGDYRSRGTFHKKEDVS